ncbi:2-dehydro-3-deoxygalactonokinase [Jejubacter calystegiae]|uniref:2-dehydro-3-deoxygalactonokinase n=1 Tax=Jejubacter calystegiae TaxID=2579935 RepID=A0A4P8YEB3_9ENTR|nr:2-dehydro-3-deoxygalactonokinase [Jejubacter calystegiae]QCT18955.1 2-dehydro-3-deoxygalactonokinase [Jejubacter calystegiae]
MAEEYIAVDWGSTHLRAWHIRSGEFVNTLALPCGVTRMGQDTAEEIFQRHLAPWRGKDAIPVVMAGMIGSESGWLPVPYLPCPATLEAPGEQRCAVAKGVWIVPGLKSARHGVYNVMRGEETQLLGAYELAPASCYVMPGTHCKWVPVAERQVAGFDTVMTGELHHLLLTHSLVGQSLPAQKEDEQAFHRGLETGLEAPSVLPRLFETRAAWLLGALARESVSDYLSGLLIGAEVAAQSAQLRPESVVVVGSEALVARYLKAFSLAGITASACDGERAFVRGIGRIMDAGK